MDTVEKDGQQIDAQELLKQLEAEQAAHKAVSVLRMSYRRAVRYLL